MFWIFMIILLLYLALQIMMIIQINVIQSKVEKLERRIKEEDADRRDI